jgi:hypothetical protein
MTVTINTLAATGQGPVSLSTTLAGEDITNGWIKTISGAYDYYPFKPLTFTSTNNRYDANTSPVTGIGPLSGGCRGLIVGNAGAVGDYIEGLMVRVINNAGNTRVYLQDGNQYITYSSGGNCTWSSGTPTSFTFNKSITAEQDATSLLVNNYLVGTFYMSATPGNPALLARRITAAVAGSSPVLTIDSPAISDPTGSAITPNSIPAATGNFAIISLLDVFPAGITTVGSYYIPLKAKSKNGGWRIFVDSCVSVVAIGKFS